MNILITGAGGFIGQNVTKRLISLGHKVTITANGSDPILGGVHKILYPSLDGIDWSYVKGQDAVIHLLANNDTLCQDEKEMYRVNVYGPMKLFTEALSGGCKKFIYASSTAVYGNSKPPYNESSTPIQPLNVYAKSKAEFDRFAMEFGEFHNVHVVGLRYCNVYGPGEELKGKRMSMIGQLIRKIKNKEKVTLFEFGEQERDWVYVQDVVNANLLALNAETIIDVFNIGSGVSTSFNQIIDLINKQLEENCRPNYIPCPFKESYQNHTLCNIDKAKHTLGYNPEFDIQAGITQYCQELFFE